MRSAFYAGLLVLTLAACGPPHPETKGAPKAAAHHAEDAAAHHAEDMAAMQAAIANLPAPYDQASYEDGRRVFAQCRSCHTIDEGAPNRVGPNLHGVFGREVGTAPNFTYSETVGAADFEWDADHLDHWLANPQSFLPGNRMAFAGVRNETQRRDVIAYLMVETEH